MVYSCTRNCPSICMHTRMLIGQEIPVIDHSPVLTLFFLVTILCLAWSSKKQKSIVRSSIEAKYRAMVSIASKVLWVKCFFFFFFFFFQNLMFQFHHHLLSIMMIWVQYIFVQIQCFAMRLIFILFEIKFNHVSLGSHVSIVDQLADALTNKAPIFYMSSSPYLLYEFKPYILQEFKPFESRLTHLEGVY